MSDPKPLSSVAQSPTLAKLTCECCRREDQPVVGVVSSSVIPMSNAICAECVRMNAEPLWVLNYLKWDVAEGNKAKLREGLLTTLTSYTDGYKTFAELWDDLHQPKD